MRKVGVSLLAGAAIAPPPRRRIGVVLAIVAALAAVGGVVLGTGASSSQGASKQKRAAGAATVQRRDLVSTDTESGTLGYAQPETVFNRMTGTVTSLPAVGQVVKPGQTLYTVDGAPVVLFDGTMPAYRDLSEGVTDGSDVEELKANLRALGFDPGTVNETFDADTAAAVDRWQAALGQTQTGTVSVGQVVFLPGPQRVTLLDTVLGSTGGSSGSGTGTGSGTAASLTGAASHTEFVDLTTTTTTPATTTTTPTTTTTTPATTTTPTSTPGPCDKLAAHGASHDLSADEAALQKAEKCQGTASTKLQQEELAALIALLKAETAQLKRSGASTGSGGAGSASGRGSGSGSGSTGGGSSSGGGGGGGAASSGASGAGGTGGGSTGSGTGSSGGNAQAILQTTSTQLVVSVDLDATKQSEAVVGEPVTVELPNGDTVDAKITDVSPVAESSSSSSGSGSGSGGGSGSNGSSTPSATVPVTIALKGHVPASGLDQAAVSVNFEQQVENHVLSVPVTALVATNGGGYAVQEAGAPHTLIPVTPGLFAAGYVQISGTGIYPGLQVTDSQG